MILKKARFWTHEAMEAIEAGPNVRAQSVSVPQQVNKTRQLIPEP